ncbi:MAG: nucleotidyltransferase domain-containing protein [Candidatus Cloacimonetes bacterium]|nr:nucleotidyltransferase domain-containing protein [Candidatus Cloacimonadota bacterium]MBL7086752.1 nucleotidyltransferase domain-containing protein [Candidatus Cloacimonadota bacterium]
MDKRSLEIARQLKKDIKKNLSKGSTSGGNVIDMRIFGSRARDDFEKDSDLDIYIELEENSYEIEDKIFNIIWEIGFENNLVITTIIFTRDELENGPIKYSPIYKNIMREGLVL